jgi:hypothetical protein
LNWSARDRAGERNRKANIRADILIDSIRKCLALTLLPS